MSPRVTRPLLALTVVVGVSALVQGVAPEPASRRAGTDPIVLPHVLDAARRLVVVDAAVLICNPAATERPLVVEAFSVTSGGATLVDEQLGVELAADARFAELNALIERMPEELTELRRPRAFAAEDEPVFAASELADRWLEIDGLVDRLRADYGAGAPRPYVEPSFRLPLDQVFAPEDPPGTVRTLELRVRYRLAGGPVATASASHAITLLPAPLAPPPTLAALGGTPVTLRGGDTHVHSCHGEAMGACAPSTDCAAESFQTSGSFSYAQLKTQYQALGVDWFTATDHSYCINSDAEYATIVAETAALTDASFLCIPDIELSSEEEGPQTGSDLGNLLCLFGPAPNHMGAHGITSRKVGGNDPFLGFCSNVFGFSANATAIRAEGGYPIVNHPMGSSFGWNSVAATQGIEGSQMHGVEIWNGATQSGQGGNVASWVDWMLDGRVLYAYSGSDTHDAVFGFGLNQAVFQGEPFTRAGLESVLKRGRSFVSNGHVLILEVERAGVTLPMGSLDSLAPGHPADPLTVRAHYNFGADTSTITIFQGRAGDVAETVLCQSGPLTGSGVFECATTLQPGLQTWYRAYSESGSLTAYTNPVFFLPSTCAYVPYGTGLGGANVATLSNSGPPAIGDVTRFEVAGFDPAAPAALLPYSFHQLPAGVPFAGGFLLINLPWPEIFVVPLGGGSGSIDLPIPLDTGLVGTTLYFQAGAPDSVQPGGFAFTNGLTMTVCNVLQ